jgi:hypothetical protein
MATLEKHKTHNRDRLVKYILDIARNSDIDISIANEQDTRQILNKLPSLSKQIVKNRHN